MTRLPLALPLALAAVLMAQAAQAGTTQFRVGLAGLTLGSVTFATDGSGRPAALATTLDSTPLGVLDGTWEATSQQVQTSDGQPAIQFQAVTASTRKNRVITIVHADGRVLGVSVTPEEEVTELSRADAVPAGVVDPVEAFGRLATANGCPAAFRLYDGRRLIDVTPSGASQDGALLTCELDYEVAAGPAHLNPLGFRSFGIEVTYDLSGGAQVLSEVSVSAGLFTAHLTR